MSIGRPTIPLSPAQLSVSNNHCYCGTGSGTIKDLIYTHPTQKQCNYSVDLSNYATKDELSLSSSPWKTIAINVTAGQNIQFSTDYAAYLIVARGTAGEVYDTNTPSIRLDTIEGEYELCNTFYSNKYMSSITFAIFGDFGDLRVTTFAPIDEFHYTNSIGFKSGNILTVIAYRVPDAKVDVYAI